MMSAAHIRKGIVGSFLLLLLAVAPAHAQKQFDKFQDKAQAAYEEGNYKAALKFNDKLISKSTAKLGASNSYLPYAYINRAQILLDNGILVEVDTTVGTALDMSAAIFGEDSQEHAAILLKAVNVMLDFGQILKAKEFLDKSLHNVEGTAAYEELKTAYVRAEARVLMEQGYYREALRFIDQKLPELQGLTSETITFKDQNGQTQSVSLTKDEAQRNFQEYARLLTLKGNIFREQGNYTSSDSAFIYAEAWILAKLNRNDRVMAENVYWQTRMLDDNGAIGFPEQGYEKALRILSKSAHPAHRMFVDINESYIKYLIRTREVVKAGNLERLFEKNNRKYYGQRSFNYIQTATLQLENAFVDGNFKRLETNTLKLIGATHIIPSNHPVVVEWLDFLHKVAVAEGRYDDAKTYLEGALNLKEDLYGAEAPEYHATKLDLAHFYLKYTDNLEEAAQIYEESYWGVVSKEITVGNVKYLDYLADLAELSELQDNYKLASEMVDQMATIARTKYDDQDIEYGKALTRVASLQLKIGEYSKAFQNLLKAQEILEEFKGREQIVYLAQNQEVFARLYAIYGMYDEASGELAFANRLRNKAEQTGESQSIESLDDLAILYVQMGLYTVAEDLLEEIFEIKNNLYSQDSRRLITPITTSSQLKLIRGDYSDAEKGARRAYQMAVTSYGEESTKIIPSLSLITDIYVAIGDYEKAEDRLREIIRIQEREFGRNHINVALALAELGLVKFYMEEDYPEIEALYEEALQIIETNISNVNPNYALVLQNLAGLYIATDRLGEANAALEQAQAIWESRLGRRNNINLADIYLLHGDIYYAEYNYDDATKLYNKALRLFEKFFSEEHPSFVRTQSRLAKVYYMSGDQRRAKNTIEQVLNSYNSFIKNYFPALSEREKAKYWNTIKADYEFYNTMAITMQDRYPELVENIYNNALLTKALLLNSSIKMRQRILNSDDAELKRQYSEWLEKKELLTSILSMSQEEIEQNNLNPQQLANDVELLEKDLSEGSEAFAQGFENEEVTWKEVRKALGPGEVAIEMVRFRFFDQTFTDSVIYAVMLVKEDSRKGPQLVLLNNGADMEGDYLHYYRNSIKYRLTDRYSYDIFWKPIQDAVGTAAKMFVSVDGVYNQINVEAIPTGENRYVIDNSNIILISNTKDIFLSTLREDNNAEKQNAVMFGDPEFYVSATDYNPSGKISDLPGTREEGEELKRLLAEQGWATDEYVENMATEVQVKQMENPRVFHIATHGFFEPGKDIEQLPGVSVSEAEAYENPLLRTGLLLSGAGNLLDQTDFNFNLDDGILTAYEAMNLNLDYTDLVVLSACETGLGEIEIGEGVYGLQRAFLVAGAKSLIMSLFKVPDEATQKLMVKFYTKWLETGDKRQAFIEAKKEIRNEFQEPYYWGAFVMIGIE
ncbi:MAG TPA: hypothetical protein DCE41_00465 [Cytophagales bacterium]|nr:hypothetical protein [Cytophagales bacterium]